MNTNNSWQSEISSAAAILSFAQVAFGPDVEILEVTSVNW